LRKDKKGQFLNSLEKYLTFLASKQEIHINEFGVDHNNPIYETVYQQLQEYPTDSSTPTSPVPNKTNTPYTMVFHIDTPQDTHPKYVTLFKHTLYRHTIHITADTSISYILSIYRTFHKLF
jgi:hypothetical protein